MPDNPFDTAADWVNENLVEPAVDLAEDVIDTAGDLVNEAANLIGSAVGDVLRALGIDPDALADEFNNMTQEALGAFVDFMNALLVLKDKSLVMISSFNLLANSNSSYSRRFNSYHVNLGRQLGEAIQAVLGAVRVVGQALNALFSALPALNLRQVVVNTDPRLAGWLQI